MLPTEPIRPLHDVWLRPRRVFRSLAQQPINAIDYGLGALQGVAGVLAVSRATNAGASTSVAEIFGGALLLGSLIGVASLFLMGTIYARLASRTGKRAARNQVFHVLAYGGVPVVASLILWILTALLAGETAFLKSPGPDLDGFVSLLLHMQSIAYVLLAIWSVVIQVMGFSEIQGLATRRALGLWIVGQLIGYLALMFVIVLLTTLFPNLVPA